MDWLMDEIGTGIMNGLRTLLASINATIYELIGKMYNLFLDLATVDLLSSDVIGGIYTRVSLLLGLFMLFKLLFSFLQMMVTPDLITDKQRGVGNIILRIIIVVVLLGSTPAIFQAALKFQNLLLNNNVIEKLVLQEIPTAELAKGKGNYLSWNVFNTFYYLEDPSSPEHNCEADEDLKYFENEVYTYGTYNLIKNCLYESFEGYYTDADGNQYGSAEDLIYKVHFDGWTAIAVGIFVLWILLMYCISLGVRVIQLAFLQLIAPIPIISYLMPTKNDTLQKWVKQCITTYLDVFLRIAIMSFVMLVIRLIFHDSVLEGYSKLVILFIILGLLLFAKKAPELLKELFPSGGAASISKGIKGGNALSALGAGAVGGAIGFLGGRGAAGRLTGALGGMSRGAYNGMKSGKFGSSVSSAFKDQRKRNLANYSKYDPNLSASERLANNVAKAKNSALQSFGFANEIDKKQQEIKQAEKALKAQKEQKAKLDRQKEAYEARTKGYTDLKDGVMSEVAKGKYNSVFADEYRRVESQLDHFGTEEGRKQFFASKAAEVNRNAELIFNDAFDRKFKSASVEEQKKLMAEYDSSKKAFVDKYTDDNLTDLYVKEKSRLSKEKSDLEEKVVFEYIDTGEIKNNAELNGKLVELNVKMQKYNETADSEFRIDDSDVNGNTDITQMSGASLKAVLKSNLTSKIADNAEKLASNNADVSSLEREKERLDKELEKMKKKLDQNK